MMVAYIHLLLDIVTYSVYEVYFNEGFSSYEIPYHRFFREIIFMVENIVNCFASRLP